MTSPIGLIAGTGFYDLTALRDPVTREVNTAYGLAQVTEGTWHGLRVAFVARHGSGHTIPPHRINYRANIAALAELGVTEVVSLNTVGAIDPTLATGSVVCVDDFLDFTKGRVGTFHDGDRADETGLGTMHADMSVPYDPGLSSDLAGAGAAIGTPVVQGGTYACFEGPRFESRAEIRLAATHGASVAGMTGVPEVTLAVEAGLRYAALALVVNPAAGVGDAATVITIEDIRTALQDGATRVLSLVDEFLRRRASA